MPFDVALKPFTGENCSTAGLGPFTLTGPMALNWNTLLGAFGAGAVVVYTAATAGYTVYERGYGTVGGDGTLTRDFVFESSNGDELVDFTGNTPFRVYAGDPATHVESLLHGHFGPNVPDWLPNNAPFNQEGEYYDSVLFGWRDSVGVDRVYAVYDLDSATFSINGASFDALGNLGLVGALATGAGATFADPEHSAYMSAGKPTYQYSVGNAWQWDPDAGVLTLFIDGDPVVQIDETGIIAGGGGGASLTPTTKDSGSQATSGTTEHDLVTITDAGVYRPGLDINDAAGGATPDILEWACYVKGISGGTERLLYKVQISGAQSEKILQWPDTIEIPASGQLRVTLKAVQGGATVPWWVTQW